jgi:cell division septal protein FtsQ
VAFTVTARQPFFVLPHGKRYYPVDEEGLLLEEEGAPRPDLPIVFGLDSGPVQVGQRLPGPTLRPIQECIRAARERGVDLARLALARDGTVRLCTSWEEVVRLGPVREVGRKLDLFAVARRDLRQRDREFEYIDVSVPDTPVWKPRRPAVSQGDTS